MRKRALRPLMASAIAAISLFATLEFALISGATAQLPLEEESISSAPVNAGANLKASAPEESGPALPTLIEMSDGVAVRSMDMLMVSVMVQQVEKARTPKGAKKIAANIAKEKYDWGRYQFSCLNTLWTKESNWNYRARNPRTGAHGIPQALPAAKMDVIGTDWRTNPVTQIRWGLHYIDVRYETPCKALAKFKRSRYY
ncbi:MAG: lytic transglycosylase domain-containing protein [Candidatus Nanopelagicaceae bacterium]